MVEIWDAYLANGKKTGKQLKRGQILPKGYYHLVVEAIIQHADGDFLLLQRSSEKSSFPNYWEFSCGGSALTGEMAEQAIRREIKEETGLTQLSLSSYDSYRDDQHQCLFEIFLATTTDDKDDLQIQSDEVRQAIWLTPNQLEEFLTIHPLIPSHEHRARRFISD